MINLIGYPKVDPTLRHFSEYLNVSKVSHSLIDLGSIVASSRTRISVAQRELIIQWDESEFSLKSGDNYYQRIFLPKLSSALLAQTSSIFNSEILAWLENCEGLVINKPSAATSNSCKYIQMNDLQRCGFRIPLWQMVGHEDSARAFVQPDGNWISKGAGSIRSRAVVVDRDMFSSFELLRITPSLLQRRILGEHVRVHCVANEHLAIGISCESVDYRYLQADDVRQFRKMSVPEHVILGCQEYMHREGSHFLGFDFVIERSTGIWWLLEANPMPGYDFYDKVVDNNISLLLSRLLQGEVTTQPAAEPPAMEGVSIIGIDRLPFVSGGF